ncbi:hypothetical protein [Streptomyces tremellae]|uniref:Small hydrophobic protein n=1 Tax=Streptomyces tremellae TaxID=1124239 RepID=A0ABP7EE00_9ACTN
MTAISWLLVLALLFLVAWLFLGFDVPDRLAEARVARRAERRHRRGY